MAIAHTQSLATNGVASISHAPIGILSGTTVWTEGFYTLKDSIAVSQGDPAVSEIKVDQIAAPVAVAYDGQTVQITGTIVDTAQSLLKFLYDDTATDPYAPASTHTGTGIKTTVNVINKMFKITFATGQSLIVTNGSMVAAFDGTNLSTTALGNKFTINVMAGLGGVAGEEADIVIWN